MNLNSGHTPASTNLKWAVAEITELLKQNEQLKRELAEQNERFAKQKE